MDGQPEEPGDGRGGRAGGGGPVPVLAKAIETGAIDAFPVGFTARAAGLY